MLMVDVPLIPSVEHHSTNSINRINEGTIIIILNENIFSMTSKL